jgi:hypothetical protein
MSGRFKGFCCRGDKGYLSKKKAEILEKQGLRLLTKVRRNMKQKTLTAFEKFFLAQRVIIETVIDQLKALCQIEHTRHRNPDNFIVYLVSGLIAYMLRPQKPSLKIPKNLTQMNLLMSN